MKFKFKKKNKLQGNKKSLRQMFSVKHLYYLVYIVGIGTMIYIGYFIYKNYYQTITQAQEIIDLKKEVAPESIDLERVNKVLEAIDNKSTSTNAIIDPNTNNPFKPLEILPETEKPVEAETE